MKAITADTLYFPFHSWFSLTHPFSPSIVDVCARCCRVASFPIPFFFHTSNFPVFAEPAIRVVDEQGYEIRDRYYKTGSTIDLSCQVALSYLNKNATSIAETSMPMPYKSSTASIKENLIDVPVKPKGNHHANDNFYKRIVWKKDGENVSKDALFNLR